MKRCLHMVDAGRRKFLLGTGAAAAGVTAAGMMLQSAEAAPQLARITYPSSRLAALSDLKLNEPFNVSYPDADAPGVLLKLGKKVEGGAGPDGDIVGFTTICPHKGVPLAYRTDDSTFNCPGHYSRFDAEKGGLEIWGHATQNLPQYILRVDSDGSIYAEGLDELLYGRLSNVLA
jgi:arsenite oxidase small subunit